MYINKSGYNTQSSTALQASFWQRHPYIAILLGFFLLSILATTVISLLSWTITDTSLSHVGDDKIQNLLGVLGAYIADFMMHIFGLASIAVVWPLFFLGILLIKRKTIGKKWCRTISWLLFISALCLSFSLIPSPNAWILNIGIGGLYGDLLKQIAFALIPALMTGWLALLTTSILIFLIIFTGLIASGLIFRPTIQPVTARKANNYVDIEEELSDFDFAHNMDKDKPNFLESLSGRVSHLALRTKSLFNRLKFKKKPSTAYKEAEPAEDPIYSSNEIDIVYNDHKEADFELNHLDPAQELDPLPSAKPTKTVEENKNKLKLKTKKVKNKVFKLPKVDFLEQPFTSAKTQTMSKEHLRKTAEELQNILEDFGVKGQIVQVRPGPVVTLYELEPAPGIKSARVVGLADDIARSMSAISARVAVVPGRNAIGIELPNHTRETVYLREMFEAPEFKKNKHKLALALGKTIGGEVVFADLAKMPHLLVAGTTGSGKSVAINTMILSLLYQHSPEQCRLIMVDPKMLELSIYDGIPHLLTPVVTDPKKAVVALKWAVKEMEDRYRQMAKLNVRNIDGFNQRLQLAASKNEQLNRTIQTGFNHETGEAIYETEYLDLKPLPYIVIIIDEMADLMIVAGKEIESTIQRLAQMARAAGIHVIMATQRPSVDVITGTIKANFPTRISFQVTSKIDSRTILGEQGAEQLLGQGDMLFMMGGGRIQRIHGPFVDDAEVEQTVNFLKTQGVPEYLSEVTAGSTAEEEADENQSNPESKDLFTQAVEIILRDKKVSISYIQRRLGIGYNRAASIIERMEEEGIISPASNTGKRTILIEENN